MSMSPQRENGTTTQSAAAADLVAELRARVSGQVIAPDDAEYDAARTVFYAGFDRRPAAVVRVADAADVAKVVVFARETGTELAVRSGGHSGAGVGILAGGFVIDRSRMRILRIDPDSPT